MVHVFKNNGILGKIKHSNEYKTLENKLILKNYRMENKRIAYRMLKLKYGNAKLSNIWKYEYMKSVLGVLLLLVQVSWFYSCLYKLYYIVLSKLNEVNK